MSILEGFQKLASSYKSTGGRFLKNMAIELFIETYHGEIVERLAMALSMVKPEDVPAYVRGEVAFPIPPAFFETVHGFEDYLESFEIERFMEFIAEANPLITAALMDMEQEGYDYLVRFKKYIVDSVREAMPAVEEEQAEQEEKEAPAPQPAEEEVEEAAPIAAPGLRTKVISPQPPETESEAKEPPSAEPTPMPAKPLRKKTPQRAKKAPAPKTKRLHCDKCNNSWEATEEEAAAITECPFCHAPA
jgi:hypothetical protein